MDRFTSQVDDGRRAGGEESPGSIEEHSGFVDHLGRGKSVSLGTVIATSPFACVVSESSIKKIAVVSCMVLAGGLQTRMKYWEIIADKLSKAGWSWGCISDVDSNGQTHNN
jgi:hypothetical protein